MATIAFTKLESTVRMDVDSTYVYYKPVFMVPVISGTRITFQNPDNVNFDFTISTADTITAGGSPVTGTAEEIADSLAGSIFVEVSGGGGGGGGADLATENTWIADQHFNTGIVDVFSASQDVLLQASATNAAHKAELYVAGGGTWFDLNAYGNTHPSGPKVEAVFDSEGEVIINSEASVGDGFKLNENGTNFITADGYDSGLMKLAGNNLILDAWNGVPEYADNAAAVAASKPVGYVYRTGDVLKIVHA